MRIPHLTVSLALLAACQLPICSAQNTVFTYQGHLTDSGTNFNGAGQFEFALVTSNNSSYTTYWSNDGTSVNGSEPAASVSVAVSNGLFTVVLGDTSQPNMTAIAASLFTQPNLQLRIWFNDGVSGFAALNPAQNLTPAPYAVFAGTTSNLVSGLSVQSNTNGAPNVIGGASVNYVSNGVVGATIGGGGATNFEHTSLTNSVTGNFGTVGGGIGNVAYLYSTVGGGYGNIANGDSAMVGGGAFNVASNEDSTVAGGFNNIASGDDSTVAGGFGNIASGQDSTVGGGFQNTASGAAAVVPGGWQNIASGGDSFAAGDFAAATNTGCFVWADYSVGTFTSTADNQFLVRAGGGVGINTASPASDLLEVRTKNSNGDEIRFGYYTGGAGNLIAGPSYVGIATDDLTTRLAIIQSGATGAGNVGIGTSTPSQKLHVIGNILASGTITGSSDRNAKEHFQPVDSLEILEKVAGLPITRWDYKQDSTVTHVGPMAQDFYAAFQVGMDDKHISMVDADGVALAAIQGLNEKVEELKTENAALKERLDKLEKLINSRP